MLEYSIFAIPLVNYQIGFITLTNEENNKKNISRLVREYVLLEKI